MKYLVAVPKDTTTDDKWTTVREPVVPCFPSMGDNMFLCVPSFKFADEAEVAECDADPDDMVNRLAAEYPGLPRSLHEQYVLLTFKAVYDEPIGSRYRIHVDQNNAHIIPRGRIDKKDLWNSQPGL